MSGSISSVSSSSPPQPSQPIKQQNHDDRSVLKRKRVRQACDYCRSKKAKCDGLSPNCSNCLNNNEKCIYTQPIKRRGLPTGYTHKMERKVLLFQSLLGKLIQDEKLETMINDSLQNEQFLTNLQQSLLNWSNSDISTTFDYLINDKSALQNVKGIKPEETPFNKSDDIKNEELIKPSSFPILFPENEVNFTNDPSFFLNYDIFQFVSDDIDLNFDNKASTWEPVALQYHGLSSIVSGFTNKSIQQYNTKLSNMYKNPFRVGSIFNLSSFTLKANLSTHKIQLPNEIFQFPSNTRKVVDNYFQMYHCWLPMLDRVNIIRQLHSFQSLNAKNHQKIDCNMIALVWAVLALGEIGTSNGNFDAVVVNTYAKNAILALENSLTSTIETIQAMILLGLFYYQLGQWDYSWILISSGSRMAIDVRLMRNAGSGKSNQQQQTQSQSQSQSQDDGLESNDLKSCSLNNTSRERTWATVYFLNTLLSARMGRSPVVRASDWPIPKIDTEGWEEWESWECLHNPKISLENGRFLSTFNELLKEVSYLNLAITSTLDPSEGMFDDINNIDSPLPNLNYDDRKNCKKLTMKSLKNDLNNWLANLPDHCKIENYDANLLPPVILCLHCVAEMIWCVLAIRLSSISNEPQTKSLIKSRNEQYTSATMKIKHAFNPSNMIYLINYPFIDYVLTLCLNFPEMLALDSDFEKMKHYKEIKQIIQHASSRSIPCKISLEMSEIMKYSNESVHDKSPKAQESPTIANLLNSPTMNEKQAAQLQSKTQTSLQPQIQVQTLPSTMSSQIQHHPIYQGQYISQQPPANGYQYQSQHLPPLSHQQYQSPPPPPLAHQQQHLSPPFINHTSLTSQSPKKRH